LHDGHSGPWSDRTGFDQNGQVASGFAAKEGEPGRPRFSPVFYLADLMIVYLAAAGMMAASLCRAEEGGYYHVKLSLARSAMWVQELGFLDRSVQQSLPETDRYLAKRTTVRSVYGDICYLQSPLSFSNLRLPDVDTIEPYGASPAAWRPTR
jgi:crotonobetainyl-CoA:carnitine CoA-transferase CaiB-like acyl-CoA transferase